MDVFIVKNFLKSMVALCLILLFTTHAPTIEAGIYGRNYAHFYISKRVVKQATTAFGSEATNRLIAWNELIISNRATTLLHTRQIISFHWQSLVQFPMMHKDIHHHFLCVLETSL